MKNLARIAALVLAFCLAAGLTACGQAGYESPYTWSNLRLDGDRLTYTEDGETLSRIGIDVSQHQGSIDWQAVAGDGIQFAFVRMGYRGTTEGGLFEDEQWAANAEGAEAAGIELAGYFFSQATTAQEAAEEAAYAIDLAEQAGLPAGSVVAYDLESGSGTRAGMLTQQQATECARAFCQAVEQAGYTAALYGNANDLGLIDADVRSNRIVWLAQYATDVLAGANAEFDFTIWQYANDGSVAGIQTTVDLNLWIALK